MMRFGCAGSVLAALAAGVAGCGGDTAPVTRPIDLPPARDGVEAGDEMPAPDRAPDDDRPAVADPGADPTPRDGMEIPDPSGETVEPVLCHDDQDCVEALGDPPACHYRACHPDRHECEVRVAADGFPCEDGDPCTLGDRCVEGECVPGDRSVCDDGNPCTDDLCNPDGSCRHPFNQAPCEDGDPCTANDACHHGDCVPGDPADCDDHNPCTGDECEPGKGCLYRPAEGPCEDGNVCTTGDRCAEGVCIGGPPLDCDDHAPCTTDSCVPGEGCVHDWNKAPCDDGDPCTTQDRCHEGDCLGGPPLDCDDHDPCTLDFCVPMLGCRHGEVPEVCNGQDDDCDGETDEEGAKGCVTRYLDEDGDGWGVSSDGRCLCGPEPPFTALQAGDCDDGDAEAFPDAHEACNDRDDDCDGKTDEDPVSAMCPVPAGTALHGKVGCEGRCRMVSCDGPSGPQGVYVPGWYDVDEDYRTGCECQADPREAKGGETCEDAIPLGTLPDTGQRLTVGGNLVPASDEDWFVVEAVDTTWNAEKDACDRFNLTVLFTKNPDDAFRVEVRRGGCGTLACPQGEVFEWATNFSTNAAGECKCSLVVTTGCAGPPDFQACVQVTKDPFRCGACPGVATQGTHACSDNGKTFFIRVRRAEGAPPSCDPYEIEISNGLYVFGG